MDLIIDFIHLLLVVFLLTSLIDYCFLVYCSIYWFNYCIDGTMSVERWYPTCCWENYIIVKDHWTSTGSRSSYTDTGGMCWIFCASYASEKPPTGRWVVFSSTFIALQIRALLIY